MMQSREFAVQLAESLRFQGRRVYEAMESASNFTEGGHEKLLAVCGLQKGLVFFVSYAPCSS